MASLNNPDNFYFGRKKFLEDFHLFFSDFNFTCQTSGKNIVFLDVIVNLMTFTDLHTKNTYCHQYLHCNFSDPEHVMNSIIFKICLHRERHSQDMIP